MLFQAAIRADFNRVDYSKAASSRVDISRTGSLGARRRLERAKAFPPSDKRSSRHRGATNLVSHHCLTKASTRAISTAIPT